MVRGRGGHREGEPSPLFVAVLYCLTSYRTLTKSERREGSLSQPSSSSSTSQPVWQPVCQSVSLSVSHRVTLTDTIARNRQREPRGRGEGERGRQVQTVQCGKRDSRILGAGRAARARRGQPTHRQSDCTEAAATGSIHCHQRSLMKNINSE